MGIFGYLSLAVDYSIVGKIPLLNVLPKGDGWMARSGQVVCMMYRKIILWEQLLWIFAARVIILGLHQQSKKGVGVFYINIGKGNLTGSGRVNTVF